MQSIFERVVSGDAATIGTIGVQTKTVFISPPLTCYPFEAATSKEADIRVLNASPTQNTDCISLAHDERYLAYASSTAIKLIDLQTGRETRTLVGHNGRINAVTQSNRSIYLWASAATDCTVTLWDTRQHPANVQVRRFDRPVNCARYSPNDAFIALGSDHLYMMDPRVREYRSLPSSSQVLHVCFHPSEYLLATGSGDRLVRFWDIDTEECVSQSDPADGTLREVAFQSDGTALLTLTDCKCSAISWEPFEMLGQCMVPQTDYSLGLAASDAEVYVLGRSVSMSSISLLMAPYAKLLAQEELLEKNGREGIDGELKKEDFAEISPDDGSGNDALEVEEDEEEEEDELLMDKDRKDIELEQKRPSPLLQHYYEEQRAFVPRHTLPRTPPPPPAAPSRPPVRVVPHNGNIPVTMATTATAHATTTAAAALGPSPTTSMPTRPKTLKDRRSDGNSKSVHSKVTPTGTRKNVVAGNTTIPRSTQSGLPISRKSQHLSSCSTTTMKVANSAPDVRCTPSRKQDEKNRTRRGSDERKRAQRAAPVAAHRERDRGGQERDRGGQDRDQEPVPSEPCSLDDVLNGLDKLEMMLSERRTVLEDVLQYWRTRGSDVALTEAARSRDTAVLVELIDAFNHTPTAWNLTLCATVLPHIEPLLAQKNEDYVEVALSALRTIITGCGDVIRTGSHRRPQIGVDVPAEERHSKCIRCMQQLTNMRVKAALLADHMSKPQAREFNALMQIFDDTLSPT